MDGLDGHRGADGEVDGDVCDGRRLDGERVDLDDVVDIESECVVGVGELADIAPVDGEYAAFGPLSHRSHGRSAVRAAEETRQRCEENDDSVHDHPGSATTNNA